MSDWLWLIPLLPFVGAFLNGVLFRNRVSKSGATWIACGSVGASLLVALGAIGQFLTSGQEAFEKVVYLWIPAGLLDISDAAHGASGWANLEIPMGFLLDPLSSVMVFVVTFVGFWIHVYSVGYMSHERGYQRYFVYLNLFMGAMLLLVMGNNYLVTFVGWEGVGLCSYLLIGFYYEEEFPPYAGRKAFIVNRIGDFAFLLGLFALVSKFGTLDYTSIFSAVAGDGGHGVGASLTEPYVLGLSFAGFVALCLFIGAMGKSAQIPLYVWLPDAMAGPTPVSALIHAATMVTAGVYMVVRSNAFFQLAPGISGFVAVIGAVTALFAATIGLAQTDIKKVLAYSTVSQLGYMFLAAGVGAYGVAIFHLGTHAFFKALLFLGSGSVIHAMGGEQDMTKMGGLKKALPVTYWTMLIGTLAIAGVPGLAGFFSKDQILAAAWGNSKVLWVVGLLTAGLTACYMFRLIFMTFTGEFRGSAEQEQHLHESPKVMTVPLMVLAVGSVLAGYVGLPKLGSFDWNVFGHYLEPVVAAVGHGDGHGHHASVAEELILMALSVVVAGLGIYLAWTLYGSPKGESRALAGGAAWAKRFPAAHKLLVNKYWVDEIYDASVVRPLSALGRFCWKVLDGMMVEGAVHAPGLVARVTGELGRLTTTGNVRSYLYYAVFGMLLLGWWVLAQ